MPKKIPANIYVEFAGKQFDIKDLQKKVAEVKGTTNAYVNTVEGRIYCVQENGSVKEIDLN